MTGPGQTFCISHTMEIRVHSNGGFGSNARPV